MAATPQQGYKRADPARLEGGEPSRRGARAEPSRAAETTSRAEGEPSRKISEPSRAETTSGRAEPEANRAEPAPSELTQKINA